MVLFAANIKIPKLKTVKQTNSLNPIFSTAVTQVGYDKTKLAVNTQANSITDRGSALSVHDRINRANAPIKNMAIKEQK